LGRHLHRAFELMCRWTLCMRGLDMAEAALDHHRCAVFVLDAQATIRFANARARALLAEGDGLLSLGRRLTARHNGDGAHLAAAVAAAHAKRAASAAPRATSLVLRRGPNRLPLLAMLIPGTEQRRVIDGPASAPGVMMFVADPSERSTVAAELLREAFGLTDREVSVALATVRFGSLPAAAAELHIAPTTARTHLQQVFEKTGVHHQVALAQMLAALGALPGAAADD
jgi:DNA-binding CsgD family transcriptional regulator